jgi:ParB-like chromosome segregation protein Spo0J
MSINWTLKKFKIKDLIEFSKNPRQIDDLQYTQLKISLEKFGLIDKPIVNTDGLIIGGHQRKRILEKEGFKEIECWVPDRELDEKEVEELNIRHNKNTGEWDDEALANQWEVRELLEWGFNLEELAICVDTAAEEGEEEEKKKETVCPECGQEIGS